MVTRYSVIQYVPDPITEERVNVGIVGFSDGQIVTHFLRNWQRVRMLAGKDAPALAQLEAIFQEINEARLLVMIGTWQNSIQFTEPGTSLRSLGDTIAEAARRFLVDPALPTKNARTHSDVVSFARDSLNAAVTKQMGPKAAKHHVRRDLEVPGRFGVNRRFDLGVRNGKPIHAIQALSFEGSKTPERRVEATAFLAEEIKGQLPLTVIVAPAPIRDSNYENARITLSALGAEVVTEDEFDEVADKIAAIVSNRPGQRF